MLGTLDIFLLAFTRVYLIFSCLEQIRLLFFVFVELRWENTLSHKSIPLSLVAEPTYSFPV